MKLDTQWYSKTPYFDPTYGHRRKENEAWIDWWLSANNLYFYHERELIPIEWQPYMLWKYRQKYTVSGAVDHMRGVKYVRERFGYI